MLHNWPVSTKSSTFSFKSRDMGTIELKSNIHKIVDGIQNEELLQTIYQFLQNRSSEPSGGIWESLSESQREEIILAYEESFDEENLLDADSLFNRDH